MSESIPPLIVRPSFLRRAAAGAWHVPAGFALLLTRPSLWPLALLPDLLVMIFLAIGFLLAAFAGPSLEGALAPGRDRVPPALGVALTIMIWVGTLGAGMLLGLAAAYLLAAPLLDRLSRRVEQQLEPAKAERLTDVPSLDLASLWSSLYFLAAALGAFLLSLVPLVGPVLAATWGAHALAMRLTEDSLRRRGLGFRDQRAWHRDWRAESLGFGLAGLVTLVVPVVNFLVGPALTIGGTLLVLDLESLSSSSAAPEGPGPA